MTDIGQRITAFVRRLSAEDVNMHGWILSVNGRDIAEALYGPFRDDQPHRLYSISKTMTGLAIGLLMDEGKLRPDQRIADFFPDWLPADPSPWLTELTIGDMLRMATCYRRTTYREGIDENWAQTFFTDTPHHAPGTVFNYDTSCSQVLAALVKRLSGLEVIDFLDGKLFRPLGLRDERFWLRDPSGCCQGGSGLCMSLRDLHRVGLCPLRGGEGLLPAWYVSRMSEKQIDTPLQTNPEERWGYCWQCWRTRCGWSMYGMGGQLSIFCPDRQVLLTTFADTRLDPYGVQRIYDAFFEELYPYLDTDTASAGETLRLPIPAVPDLAEPAMTDSPLYRFGDNPLGLRALRLADGCLEYENSRGPVRLPFGRGEAIEAAYPGWPEVPALVSGGWISPDQLRVRCHAVGTAPCGFDLLLRFEPGRVTAQAHRSNDPLTDGYDGTATGLAEG